MRAELNVVLQAVAEKRTGETREIRLLFAALVACLKMIFHKLNEEGEISVNG